MAANNLGTVLNEIGDLDGARDLFEQALSGYEKSLGPDHPDTYVKIVLSGVILTDLIRFD